MSFFVYRSLTPDKQRIRLIHLLPTNSLQPERADEISCTVSHVSLYDSPAFTALSYNWGELHLARTISVDGQPFKITVNLEVALRHLRLADETRTLWVDALCIDQESTVEKSEQVQQMDQIYARAEGVIAWLGPAGNDSDLAFDWIVRYGTWSSDLGVGSTPQMRLRHLLSDLEESKTLPNKALQSFLEELCRDLHLGDPIDTSRLCKCLSQIFQRPYWNRIWVVQEVVRARDLIFICGKARATEEAVHHALRLLRNFRQYVTTSTATESLITTKRFTVADINTQDPINLLKSRRVTQDLPLIHLLRLHRRFHATEPQDKIFALLGLSADGEALGVPVNYSVRWQIVYTSLARKLLMNGFTEILSLCTVSTSSAYGLPSWVPNWSIPSKSGPLQQRGVDRTTQPPISALQPRFSAGHSGKDSGLRFGADDDEQSSMTILAKLVGEVLNVGSPWASGGTCRWLQDLDMLSRQVYPSPEESLQRLTALCRASVADQEIRQGSLKPRLSDTHLNDVRVCLDSMNEEPIRVDTLVQHGLGSYCQQVQDIASHRRAFVASGRFLGIGPCELEVGDCVYVLSGCHVPFVLRRDSSRTGFQLVGETYVHGVMDDGWDSVYPAEEMIVIM